MLKIYFAGSIRGGGTDAELYRRMIEYLKKDNIVLTEHIGDPSILANEGAEKSDIDIYRQDSAWLREADMGLRSALPHRWVSAMSSPTLRGSASLSIFSITAPGPIFRLC